MPTYTIKAAMPTGKESQTYGVEYHVQFNEVDKSFPLWFKKEPEVGQEVEGNISGTKFKKVKKEWKPSEKAASSDSPSGISPAQGQRRSYSNNSDGQRQGMCINNAAAYINTLEFPEAVTNREWAELVYDYASALYLKGDLKTSEITPETVAGVFSGN